MPRFFNTAGPNRPEKNYTLPALRRLPNIATLIEGDQWFVLHAPRQSGKTTAMRALAHELTASGKYAALWATCEAGEPYRDDPAAAERIVCEDIARKAEFYLPAELRPPAWDRSASAGAILSGVISAWCRQSPRPVVLLLDEIDALQNAALISVLRQLRSMFGERPEGAPASLALIGLRDVRDYKVASGGSPNLGTPSPFNISVKSLTLGCFDRADVAELYGQHSSETGQEVTAEAIDAIFEYSQGQPWLVNALGYQLQMELKVTGPIERSHVDRAKELLVLSRATHLDSLADKLNEPRVRAVVEPMLTGGELTIDLPQRDIEYCIDLGLIVADRQGARIANPIYGEVLPRELTVPTQTRIRLDDRRWALDDGRLDWRGLLDAFVDFWRQHGEWMVRGQSWPEFAHQIVLMAFLQRVVNGGGVIDREYGLGRKRLDLLVRWAIETDQYGATVREDRHALEVRVWRDGQKDPLAEGLKQLDGYLGRLGLDAGTLMVFDARATAPTGELWETRGEFGEARTPAGRAAAVVRG